MAGFNFDSLKNGFSKLGGSIGSAAGRSEKDDELDYEEEAAYDSAYDKGYEEEYEEDGYDDQPYDEAAYEDEGAYEEEPYDEAAYEDAEDEANYGDEGVYEGEEDAYYDENSEDASYEDGEYADDEADYGEGEPDYDDYNVDPDELGFNPSVFANLDNEEDAEYADENGYADEGDYYEDGVYPEDEQADGSYNDDEEGDEPESKVGAYLSGVLAFITENEWFMYLALVILPPLGIWLLWRKNKFDISLRTAISVISFIWFILLLIWIFGGRGSNDITANEPPVDFINHSSYPSASAVVTDRPTANPSDMVSTVATPHPAATDTTQPLDSSTTSYVWTANADMYYHTLENCQSLTGSASRLTLEGATSRGKVACPVCAGGANSTGGNGTASGTTYYATTNGKWYHVKANCQSMSGASVVLEANAIAAGKTACPVCIGYYGTNGGKWYHSISNCQSMQNAVTKSEAEWKALNKTACPVCLSGSSNGGTNKTPTSTMVYATKDGKYFHTKSDCSGMKGASYVTIAQAVQAKKAMCPHCVSSNTIYVFATTGGTHFHTKNNCSGMKNAQYVQASYAIKYGKTACPDCAAIFASGSTTTGSTGSNIGSVASSDAVTYVYATANGTYMHTKSNCSGMTGASKVTYQQAVNAGKKLCPTCMKPANLTVYATSGGKWYHTVANCQGMNGALAVKASLAISYGKTACPTCAKGLSVSSTTANTSNTSNNGSTASSTNTSASANTTVYVKLGSGATNYYHVGAKCSAQGVSGASNVTLEYAIDHGYKACPSCKPPSKIY